MPNSLIRVEVQYRPRLSEAERILLSIPKVLKNLRPLMQRVIAPRVNVMLRRHWETKGAAYGHPWAPWARSTLLDRLRKGNASKGLMRDTDHLFETLLRDRPTDDRLRVIQGGLRLALNTRVPYAVFHQVGTRFMPERQVIPYPLPPVFLRGVREAIRFYLISGGRISV